MGVCVENLKRAIWIVCVVLGTAASAQAASVTLAWDPNTEPDIAGYRVSYGTTSGQYTTSVDVGNTTSHTLTNLFAGQTYYFAVQALTAAGPSPYSNEVSATLASPLTVMNLTANRTSPQPAGTAITFSATASGGTPPYQYKWWIVSGSTQTVGSNWSANASFVWTPTAAASYTIRVWARHASSTVDAPDNQAAALEMTFAVTSPGPTNQAPTASAGADQNITLPSSASLSGTVSDDGLPTGTLTRNWTRVSGPGTVTFSAPTSTTTSASFSTAGAYVLRLTVSDGALSASDDVAIVVNAPPASGSLVGAWGFNEGAGTALGDSSGNGRTGAVTGATWTTGRFGQALSFDGNDLVTLGDLDLTGPFTVMVWMQTRSLHANGCASLVMKALDYGFEICQGRLYAGVGTGSNWTAYVPQALTSADLNVWKHVTLTHDGTTLRLYIGGTLVTSAAGTHGTSDNPLLFGRWNTNGEFWNGLIDEVRIYSRALTAGEIQTDMNTPVGGVSTGQPPTLVNPGNQTHAEGSVVSLPLSATDPDGDSIVYSAAALPPGLTVNPSTGVISGTLNFTSAGTYASSATATAASQSDTKSFTWTVTKTNQAPTVNAGADQSITLPSSASLSGTVSDDGLPTGTLTRSWTRVSGPGTVTFSAPTSTTTSASFSTAGAYVVRLTVSDGALSAADDLTVTVTASASGDPTGIVAYYTFNGGSGTTAVDSSGNGITGTLAGAVWTAAGKYGNALSFNGTSAYVDLGNPTALQSSGSMTWAAWVFATGVPADDGQIIAKSNSSSGWQLKTSPDTGQHTFAVAISSGGGRVQRYSRTVRALNTWYHVAGTYNATARTLDIYVNGVLDNGVLSGTVPTAQVVSNINVNIGRRTEGFHFRGVIDEVRIYNRALTPAEISQLSQ